MFSRIPAARMNRGRVASAVQSGLPPNIPAILTYAQGLRLWIDSDYSGGVADGSTSPAPTNLAIGSNGVVGITPGAGTITYRATSWRGPRVQSCWNLVNRSFRATGSDITFAASANANWTWIMVTCPRWFTTSSPGAACYAAGFDNFASASFSRAHGISRTNNTRYNYGAFKNAVEAVVDSAVHNQAALILEQQRLGGNQLQFAYNKTQTAAVAYTDPSPLAVDGFSIGGWAGSSTGNAAGDQDLRAVMLWNKALSGAERDTVYSYIAGPTGLYSGFEHFATLGAT